MRILGNGKETRDGKMNGDSENGRMVASVKTSVKCLPLVCLLKVMKNSITISVPDRFLFRDIFFYYQ